MFYSVEYCGAYEIARSQFIDAFVAGLVHDIYVYHISAVRSGMRHMFLPHRIYVGRCFSLIRLSASFPAEEEARAKQFAPWHIVRAFVSCYQWHFLLKFSTGRHGRP